MARHAGISPEATRERLLLAAIDLIAESGLDGVTTRGVSKKAGLTLGAFHHHFETKLDLHRAAAAHVDGVFRLVYERMLAVLQTSDPYEAQLETLIRTAWRFAREHRMAVRFRMRQWFDEKNPELRILSEAPALAGGAIALSMHTGVKPEQLRIWVVAVVHALGRFAGASETELAMFAVKGSGEQAIEDGLVALVLRAFARPAQTRRKKSTRDEVARRDP